MQSAKEKIRFENFKTQNHRIIMPSKCFVCGSKKSRFVKEQETKGLLSSLAFKTSLSRFPLLGGILF